MPRRLAVAIEEEEVPPLLPPLTASLGSAVERVRAQRREPKKIAGVLAKSHSEKGSRY
jgi:hypothetical protein